VFLLSLYYGFFIARDFYGATEQRRELHTFFSRTRNTQAILKT